MFHPAAALRNPQWRVDFERDMKLLPQLVERALRADETARQGTALPAGVPHPGDPGYQAGDQKPRAVTESTDVPDEDTEDFSQLSLF
jgi:hypothetical protein